MDRSGGAIKSIEVVRSLGAASVGQAFLCRIVTDEHPAGEEVVVKILRPNVKTIIENERRRFVDAAKALADAFVKAARTYQQVMAMTAPDQSEEPDDGAFVYAIANVVNANLQTALEKIGLKMAVPIYFDMRAARAKESAAAERIQGSAARVQAYVQAFAGGAVDVATIKTIERIAQDFQRPLELPGFYDEAYAQEVNSQNLLVRDALVHFRFPLP